jgi:hypothetical protein
MASEDETNPVEDRSIYGTNPDDNGPVLQAKFRFEMDPTRH